jgi:hypothetical protein
MSPNARDYGADGAALFDIVKVQSGRGAEPGAPTKSLPLRERRRTPFVIFELA